MAGTCRLRVEGGGQCGKPAFAEGICEDHMRRRYPTTYYRLINEVKCENCLGTGRAKDKDEFMRECPNCQGRGVVDQRKM